MEICFSLDSASTDKHEKLQKKLVFVTEIGLPQPTMYTLHIIHILVPNNFHFEFNSKSIKMR